MKIAISGKGGVGKTTISTGLIYYCLNKGLTVFAVDADPDISLGTVLGIDNQAITNLKPIVDMREIIANKSGGSGAFFTLNPDVDDILNEFVFQIGSLYFLKMGAVKQGGSSCYCRENTVLNALVNSILVKSKEIVVLDMGAGIEHLTRGTANGVDLMLIVSEPSIVSINTAITIKNLATDLGIDNIKYIGNKIRNYKEKEFILSRLPEQDILGFVEFSFQALELSMGLHSMETQSSSALLLGEIGEKILSLKS